MRNLWGLRPAGCANSGSCCWPTSSDFRRQKESGTDTTRAERTDDHIGRGASVLGLLDWRAVGRLLTDLVVFFSTEVGTQVEGLRSYCSRYQISPRFVIKRGVLVADGTIHGLTDAMPAVPSGMTSVLPSGRMSTRMKPFRRPTTCHMTISRRMTHMLRMIPTMSDAAPPRRPAHAQEARSSFSEFCRANTVDGCRGDRLSSSTRRQD